VGEFARRRQSNASVSPAPPPSAHAHNTEKAYLVVRHVLVGIDGAPAALAGLLTAGADHLEAGALHLGAGKKQEWGRSAKAARVARKQHEAAVARLELANPQGVNAATEL